MWKKQAHAWFFLSPMKQVLLFADCLPKRITGKRKARHVLTSSERTKPLSAFPPFNR